MIARDAVRELTALADPGDARFLQKYFKTGKGEYGAGDRVLGIRVPTLRRLAARFRELPLGECRKLLRSPYHEARLLALLVLVGKYDRADEPTREAIFRAYLADTARVNNWDLVDLSAPKIVGEHLLTRDRSVLDALARSRSVWERRIAILATSRFIREGEFADTFRVADLLIGDEHDLIHKAVGWMLREVGNRDRRAEERYLRARYRGMPRTMLRYAIEKFPARQRARYLAGTA
jgi:3-methyladenine DNA glycosylase AlkD